MSPIVWEALRLGADVVQLLLPHRSPLLMVDRLEAYCRSPGPAVRASRFVSANEPVFAGHFPGLSLWPGVYTIEGLGQTCMLAMVLAEMQSSFERAGWDPGEPIAALKNLELKLRLDPAYRPELTRRLLEHWRGAPRTIGVSSAVDVRLLKPVFAGQRIDYQVVLSHGVENVQRFDVEAFVDRVPVARGSMSGAALTLSVE